MKLRSQILASILLISPVAYAKTAPLVEKSQLASKEVKECGVESWESETSPLCGSVYKTDSGAVCGEKTKSRLIENHHPSLGVRCTKVASGFQGPTEYNRDCTTQCRLFGDLRVQETDRSSFGPSLNISYNCIGYGRCQHESFGVAYDLSCAREEFGVKKYKTCPILKTTSELETFVTTTKALIPSHSILLAQFKSNFLFESKQQKLSTCFIERYSTDPLYEDIIVDLKATYSAIFGEEYESGIFDCTNSEYTPSFVYEEFNCNNFGSVESLNEALESDTSAQATRFKDVCSNKIYYDSYRRWFLDSIAEVDKLLNDVVAKSSPDYKSKLQTLKTQIEALSLKDTENDENIVDIDIVPSR